MDNGNSRNISFLNKRKRNFKAAFKNYHDSTDSEFEVGNKRYQLDPEFTPRKYEEQKVEIKIKDNTIKKLQDLNVRHQENSFKYEDKISKLEVENLELREQIKKLQSKLQEGSNQHGPKTPYSSMHRSSHKSGSEDNQSSSKIPDNSKYRSFHNESRSIFKTTDKGKSSHKSGSYHKQSSSNAQGSTKLKSFHRDSQSNLTPDSSKHRLSNSAGSSTPDYIQRSSHSVSGCKTQDSSESRKNSDSSSSKNPEFLPINVCETALSGSENDGDTSDNWFLESCNEKPAATNSTDEENEDKPLLDGVKASPEIWSLIKNIKAGKKGDLRFIKDLAVVGFGPETLAACTIKGTKRGHKKDNEPQRPPLNDKMLKEIFNCLVLRVRGELSWGGSYSELIKTNHRLTSARYHSALRQVQKKMRSDGYGLNKKSNDLTVDLLMDR